MLRVLTLKMLEKLRACQPATDAFEKEFGKKAKIKDVISWLHSIHDEGGRGWEAWILAQKPEITEAFLKYGANVHVSEEQALFVAADEGRSGVVRILIEKGANVRERSDLALRYAQERYHQGRRGNYPEVIRLLKKAGAIG